MDSKLMWTDLEVAFKFVERVAKATGVTVALIVDVEVMEVLFLQGKRLLSSNN
jgi:hypothetical protein